MKSSTISPLLFADGKLVANNVERWAHNAASQPLLAFLTEAQYIARRFGFDKTGKRMAVEDRIERFRKAYEKALTCRWKGGPTSIASHLQRRKKRGHLPANATESDLVQKGMEVLQSAASVVYEYIPSGALYFVVHEEWAVFFDEEGLWDTTFPPDVPERYFDTTKGYKLLGKLRELIP